MRKISAILISLVIVLTGCMATDTILNKSKLATSTQMSDSIFLAETAKKDRTIFVSVKNTSDQQQFNLAPYLTKSLEQKGYKVVRNPKNAHYVLQVNVLKAGRMTRDSLEGTVEGGYSGALVGGLAGAAGGGDTATVAGAAIAGAAIGAVANAAVKDVVYGIVTDVQIGELTINGTRQKYTTRVVSYADKMNLKFAEASPYLAHDLAVSIAGIF